MSVNTDFIKDIDMYNLYNHKRLLDTEMPAVKGMPHVFITTPALNLCEDNCNSNGFLSYMKLLHNDWLGSLNFGGTSAAGLSTFSPFIKMVYNSCTGFSPIDTVSKTKEVGETFYGYKQILPTTNIDSINGGEFSLNFVDWQGLPILHTMNTWFVYHNGVRRGEFYPHPDCLKKDILDYLASLFYFLTDMDGESIQYWCKFTGIVPINVPFSTFSSEYGDHDIVKYSINFLYSFKEDMDTDILLDFNAITHGGANLLTLNSTTPTIMKTLKIVGKGKEADLTTTEYEKNGANKPYIALAQYIQPNGVASAKPSFKLLWE